MRPDARLGPRHQPRPGRRPDPRADGAEFEALLRPVLPRAYRLALQLSGSPSDAEDLVQEAALNAWRGFHGFRPGSRFSAWFFRIVTNAFYMRVRYDRRRPTTVPLDPANEWYADGLQAAARRTPLALLLRRLALHEVLAAIRDLPPEHRTVAALYFLDDLSYAAIARIVGCPIGTVRSRLHRARGHLRGALARTAREQGII